MGKQSKPTLFPRSLVLPCLCPLSFPTGDPHPDFLKFSLLTQSHRVLWSYFFHLLLVSVAGFRLFFFFFKLSVKMFPFIEREYADLCIVFSVTLPRNNGIVLKFCGSKYGQRCISVSSMFSQNVKVPGFGPQRWIKQVWWHMPVIPPLGGRGRRIRRAKSSTT